MKLFTILKLKQNHNDFKMKKLSFYTICVFFINSSFMQDTEKKVIINSKLTYYSFIRSNDTNLTSVVIDGLYINPYKTFEFQDDSFFNRLNENKKLVKLEVNNCNLEYISDKIFNNINLQVLSMRSCHIRNCNNGIKKLQMLQKVNFDNNNITDLFAFLKSLDNNNKIKSISFSHNQINDIPNNISNLKNLEYLFLSNNQISVIPKSVSKLKKLTLLSIENNKIKEIPCFLNSFEKFELHLGGNSIKEVPCCFNKYYNEWFELFLSKSVRIPNCYKKVISPQIHNIKINGEYFNK